ncbi:methylated-DNA--[protein]-cysteine S-methyltransferase [Acinetobacter populi]|uniref:Methylated-DNA--protein-cysteine methyltransferase n=1 Tax=Acinetobacter populi TaxID=1582270 RepID=A0A1Z9YTW3_9GAMM|nr:methylated-DNA--[protein]-cysteine S-methyltransferase [Acinetobacter populi]OUY05599.1 glycosyltransferase [Acinetobacter populi]
MSELFYQWIDSPVGQLKLIATQDALVAVLWQTDKPSRVLLGAMQESLDHPILLKTQQQLQQYFAGQRKIFELPLAFYGTDFQQKVWAELLKIPYGETRSYLQIAAAVGNVKAVRAVGAANGKNPISIIAPCHRVIGKNGALTGFAGGLENKTRLLHLEQNI